MASYIAVKVHEVFLLCPPGVSEIRLIVIERRGSVLHGPEIKEGSVYRWTGRPKF
jgi:hypothetical protein